MKEFQAHLEEQLLAMGYLNCEQLQQAKDLQSKISLTRKSFMEFKSSHSGRVFAGCCGCNWSDLTNPLADRLRDCS